MLYKPHKYCIIILLHVLCASAPNTSATPFESLVQPYVNPCVKNLKDLAAANAKNSYNSYIETVKDSFRVHYMETCKNAMENLKMVYTDKEYHFTLYYYDQAGNLIKTVPPEGVALVTDANDLNQIASDRLLKAHTFFTKHTLQTRYEYNSLNQLIRQATPDNELMNKWSINGSNLFPAATNIYGMAFSSNATGFVVGDDGSGTGVIYTTPDGGQTWNLASTVEDGSLQDVQVIGTTGYAVGTAGFILQTTDAGITWTPVGYSNTTNTLNAVALESATTGIAVGDQGVIVTITGGTGGNSVSGGSNNLNDITFLNSTTYVAVGNSGEIIKTVDGGATWTSITSTTAQDLNAVYFVNNTGFAAGASCTILKTTDGGNTWNTLTTGITATLREIYFKDYSSGYALGDGGTLLKTIDGGLHWIAENNPPLAGTDGNFYTAHFTDDGHALLAGTTSGAGSNLSILNDESNDFSSRFWYDRLGRLVVSQNTKQFNKSAKAYSYTKYDPLGRIIEVGETATAIDIASLTNTHGVIGDDAAYIAWLAAGTHTEITSTLYDDPVSPAIPGFTQENLRKRVSATFIDDNGDGINEQGSLYNYDIHGNVKSLLQENKALENVIANGVKQSLKRIDYEYDLVSGNVNAIHYQNGEPDQMHHKYEYDADNRITNVYTSNDNVIWEQDGKYFYYAHGPLARVELGDNKVQGMDYAYTIQGWIKGVNSNTLDATRDIGQDGETSTTNVNRNIAKDAFGYSLNYFTDDYKAIDPNKNLTANSFTASVTAAAYLQADAPDLYNGNISGMVTSITDLTTSTAIPQLTAYRYDQLNRISQMKAYRDINLSANAWGKGVGYIGDYQTNVTYDANGNITHMTRNGLLKTGSNSSPLEMDDLTYKYETVANGYTRNTNKLRYVQDAVGDTKYKTDIDDQRIDNYTYDEIGNLKGDVQEGINSIEWTVYGKIKKVTRTSNSTMPDLEFNYDASGNRITKIVKPHPTLTDPYTWTTTYYVRDASGNVIATYTKTRSTFKLSEQMLYGSSRLGLLNRDFDMATAPTRYISSRVLGQKNYELTNHLGNVLTTVSDRKIPVDNLGNGNGTTIAYYTADITNASDYGIWGDILPNRGKAFDNNYKYGFNGKIKDDELYGSGNSYDFGERMYAPRIGRWMSKDQLQAKYAPLSPYNFVSNSPILFVDVDGKDFFTSVKVQNEKTGRTEQQVVRFDGKNLTITDGNGNSQPLENVNPTLMDIGAMQFIDDIVTSYNYIVTNGADVNDAMKKMTSSKTVHIEIENKKKKGQYSDGVIQYDFDFGAQVMENEGKGEYKGNESPALGFWSEVYHAYIDKMDIATRNRLDDIDPEVARDKEEQYLHVDIENQVIERLKQSLPSNQETKRNNYNDAGPGPKTKSPTSTETRPKETKTKSKESHMNQRNL